MPLKQKPLPRKKQIPPTPSRLKTGQDGLGGILEKDLINVGRIGRAHGVQGWVNVISFTEPKENILSYSPWQLRWQNNWKTISVESSRILADSIIVKLSGCNDRDLAKAYTDCDIAIGPEQRLPLNVGEYYWTDLIGLTVINQDGVTLGQVMDLMETGSNDVLIVKGKKEHLIPYLPKDFVVDIDLNTKIIQVIWDPDF
jgi:16S rRNA processing protein RimM